MLVVIEQTVFANNEEVRNWVNQNYDLNILLVESCEFGSANCFYLKSETDLYFMKEFQSKITYENLATEIEVCNYLRRNGIKTSKYIPNIHGEYISQFRMKNIHIQEYISGKSYSMFEMPEALLYESGRILGKINKSLSDFGKCEISFGDEWLEGWSNEKEIEKLNRLLKERRNDVDENLLKRVYRDFEFKKSVLRTMEGYSKRFVGTYKCNSHGDYSLLQIMVCEGKIEAIVDFASVCCLPPTWEIIRSYSYAAAECRDGSNLDFNKFKKYVDQYLLENSIPAKDIVLMPSLYFFNLVRSTFGYKQFLIENKKDNLEFAFWRTNMCKWLYMHLTEFEEYLQKEYMNE